LCNKAGRRDPEQTQSSIREVTIKLPIWLLICATAKIELNAIPANRPAQAPIPGVHRLIAIGSGREAVGKTTVSVTPRHCLRSFGRRVGLLDAESTAPTSLSCSGVNQPPSAIGGAYPTHRKYGVKLKSMGFLNPGDKPRVWRGPMLPSVIQQFLRNVMGRTRLLFIDLPPGTGDVALSLIQTAPLSGAVVVTNPLRRFARRRREKPSTCSPKWSPHLRTGRNMSYLIALAPASGIESSATAEAAHCEQMRSLSWANRA